jgi:hypothetical protein
MMKRKGDYQKHAVDEDRAWFKGGLHAEAG